MKKYLIVNTGSASKKYAFYEGGEKKYSAHFELENGSIIVTEKTDEGPEKRNLQDDDYAYSIKVVLDSLLNRKIINDKEDIDIIGIRIVAPGEYFLADKIIDEEYLQMAEKAVKKVPLHLGPALEEIKSIKKFLGDNINIVGVSDSTFHASIPDYSSYYAIPIKDSRSLGLRRFGYHGISVQSLISKTKETLGFLPEKIIVCHLGGGASVTAVKNGKSIATSMGFTPLEGLIMATRVGDIDPGAVLYLSERLGKDFKELEHYFNNECGLLGLSGKSGDIRELLELEANGDPDSTLALNAYVSRIKEYIGSGAAIMGGIDLLILAGTVGERSFIMRNRICDGLSFLGIELDKELNDASVGVDVELSKPESTTTVLVIKTDEMEEIAKIVNNI
jgi:acetate kinase